MNNQWVIHHLDVAAGGEGLDEDEWLLTNGTGAYAMGTVAGANTRRYHGLLVAAARPPVGRVVALNQMLERLTPDRKSMAAALEFTSCLFREADELVYAPAGYESLVHFNKGLYAHWVYRRAGISFTRRLVVHWKEQAATLRYTVEGLSRAGALSLWPMLTLRDFHSLVHKEDAGHFQIEVQEPQVSRVNISHGDVTVALACDRGGFVADQDWWHNLYYPIDARRGQEDHEDYFLPGRFDVPLEGGVGPQVVTVTVALDVPVHPCETVAARANHLAPMLEFTCRDSDDPDGTKRMLVMAADDFVVDRRIGEEDLSTILAGYPWFADWGRDTFIALPGLLLATGRFDEARETLRSFAQSIEDGLVPNRFDDYDNKAAHYNTVDASLWFIHAAIEYVNESGDRDSWDAWLAGAITQVIEAYIKGTRHGIALAGDGLITAGSAQTQLTWMDAACEGEVFTPRFGKAVEINALWYHALLATAQLIADRDTNAANHYKKHAARAKRAFGKVFWDEDAGYLRDHAWTDSEGNEHADLTCRPNQVFAVSLAHSPLARNRQRQVINTIQGCLLTPYGLRTLPPGNADYHGQYAGPPRDRDRAYHQGTVWPWLIGPYAEAILRAGRFEPKACRQAMAVIEPLLQFMRADGMGQLHEIHEGDPPHRPVGCTAQAWSVAQVLRVLRLIEKCETA